MNFNSFGNPNQAGLFSMLQQGAMQGQPPTPQGLFSGLSAYNPEWLKKNQNSGALPYAQFAADETMRTSLMRNPNLMAEQEELERQRQAWLQQQMQQPSNPYGFSDFDWAQKQAYGVNSGGNGGA